MIWLKGVENKVPEILFHVGCQNSAIERINTPSSVHDFAHKIAQSAPWKTLFTVFERLCEVSIDDSHTNFEIRLVEIVGNVPS